MLYKLFHRALPTELASVQPSSCHLITGCLLGRLTVGPAFFYVDEEQIGLDCHYLTHFTSETHAPGVSKGIVMALRAAVSYKCPDQPYLFPPFIHRPPHLEFPFQLTFVALVLLWSLSQVSLFLSSIWITDLHCSLVTSPASCFWLEFLDSPDPSPHHVRGSLPHSGNVGWSQLGRAYLMRQSPLAPAHSSWSYPPSDVP